MTYCIAVIQILVKYFLSQSDRCFTPALHFVSSPVKLLRKTHQEMDFHKENPKLAEELKFQRQDDFTGPQMKPSLLQSDRWSMTSRGMNDRLLCYHWWTWTWFCHPLKGDVRQRVESIFIGLESRLIGSPSTIGHQREISDVGRRPAARALFSSGANLCLPPPFISLWWGNHKGWTSLSFTRASVDVDWIPLKVILFRELVQNHFISVLLKMLNNCKWYGRIILETV